MLCQLGDDWTLFALVFAVAQLVTRSPLRFSGLAAALYVLWPAFRFRQAPPWKAWQVIRPAGDTGSPAVSVIAHRGGGHDAPENTVAAIREASKNGASGVELDVGFTADGVAVLMHDDTVDRTTDGSGSLSQMSFSQLAKLDAAAKHRLRDAFAGEKVPALKEAVEECLKLGLTIYFDVKGHADQAVAVLKELYMKHPVLYDTSVVCSFEPRVIYRMRQADPDVVTALTHRPWSLSRYGDGSPRFSSPWRHRWATLMDVLLDWAHHHLLWRLCGTSAILVQKDSVSPDYVQYWARRRVALVAWTVNTAVEKQYYQDVLHVNYMTDSLLGDCDAHY